jgi:hypothetical protein
VTPDEARELEDAALAGAFKDLRDDIDGQLWPSYWRGVGSGFGPGLIAGIVVTHVDIRWSAAVAAAAGITVGLLLRLRRLRAWLLRRRRAK